MSYFQTQIFICFTVGLLSFGEGNQLLTLGLVTPPVGELGYPTVAAATTMAAEDAKSAGILRDFDIQ